MQQPLNSPTCSMFCTWVFLLGSWPAHKAAPLPFPALSMVERGPAAAGKALVGSLLRDNTASRWFPHSFSPDAFKSYSWVWAEIHRVWKAECTRESTLLFLCTRRHCYIRMCSCRMCFFLTFSIGLFYCSCRNWDSDRKTRCLLLTLPWQDYLGRCTECYIP